MSRCVEGYDASGLGTEKVKRSVRLKWGGGLVYGKGLKTSTNSIISLGLDAGVFLLGLFFKK
jgi:hypothetical protein